MGAVRYDPIKSSSVAGGIVLDRQLGLPLRVCQYVRQEAGSLTNGLAPFCIFF